MNPAARVEYERSVKVRFAAIFIAAAFFLFAAAVISLSGAHTKVDELTIDLIIEHQRFPLDVIGALVNAIGLTAFAFAASFLWRCIKARNEGVNRGSEICVLVGGMLAAVTQVIYSIMIAVKAHDFVSTGSQTYEQAHALTNGTALLILQTLGPAPVLLLAIGVVFIALNGMRVGLLTRFMGYLGMFAGALIIFPLQPVPVVQAFWLVAIALMLLGRSPTPVPPAWASGVAEPWPSGTEQRAQRGAPAKRERGARPAKPAAKPAARSQVETVAEADAPERTTRANTPKRKRKQRRK
jgi:hypothetical protein